MDALVTKFTGDMVGAQHAIHIQLRDRIDSLKAKHSLFGAEARQWVAASVCEPLVINTSNAIGSRCVSPSQIPHGLASDSMISSLWYRSKVRYGATFAAICRLNRWTKVVRARHRSMTDRAALALIPVFVQGNVHVVGTDTSQHSISTRRSW